LDAALGLVLLAAYVVGMVVFAAGVTFVAIRIFPTKDRSETKPEKPEKPSDDGAGGGRLFRKSKRGT
jgi:hypothetical protein